MDWAARVAMSRRTAGALAAIALVALWAVGCDSTAVVDVAPTSAGDNGAGIGLQLDAF